MYCIESERSLRHILRQAHYNICDVLENTYPEYYPQYLNKMGEWEVTKPEVDLHRYINRLSKTLTKTMDVMIEAGEEENPVLKELSEVIDYWVDTRKDNLYPLLLWADAYTSAVKGIDAVYPLIDLNSDEDLNGMLPGSAPNYELLDVWLMGRSCRELQEIAATMWKYLTNVAVDALQSLVEMDAVPEGHDYQTIIDSLERYNN